MKSIEVTETGGPEKLKYVDRPIPVMSENESLVDVLVAGVNFIDTYHRSGLYPRPLPFTPGVEGVGVIREIKGPALSGLSVGMRVGWVVSTGFLAAFKAVVDTKVAPLLTFTQFFTWKDVWVASAWLLLTGLIVSSVASVITLRKYLKV